MLSENQIKISDFLLKYLYSVGGKSSKDDYPEKLNEQGFNKLDWNATIQILIEYYGLIDYVGNSDNWIMLTPEGNKVVKNGINKFLDEIEHDKKLGREEKESSISGVRNAKILSIAAIAVSIMIPVSIEVFKDVINKPSKIDGNSKNGIELSHSNIPIKLTDSLFIEEVKNSLKHDTVFLNEVKQLIDKEK
jgi:hypothetical protein